MVEALGVAIGPQNLNSKTIAVARAVRKHLAEQEVLHALCQANLARDAGVEGGAVLLVATNEHLFCFGLTPDGELREKWPIKHVSWSELREVRLEEGSDSLGERVARWPSLPKRPHEARLEAGDNLTTTTSSCDMAYPSSSTALRAS